MTVDSGKRPQGVLVSRQGRGRVKRRSHGVFLNSWRERSGKEISGRREEGAEVARGSRQRPRIVRVVTDHTQRCACGAMAINTGQIRIEEVILRKHQPSSQISRPRTYVGEGKRFLLLPLAILQSEHGDSFRF